MGFHIFQNYESNTLKLNIIMTPILDAPLSDDESGKYFFINRLLLAMFIHLCISGYFFLNAPVSILKINAQFEFLKTFNQHYFHYVVHMFGAVGIILLYFIKIIHSPIIKKIIIISLLLASAYICYTSVYVVFLDSSRERTVEIQNWARFFLLFNSLLCAFVFLWLLLELSTQFETKEPILN
jgi:hypothetical protein